MNRITNTDKWKDEWFLNLKPNGKLVFLFLCDNCDDAGFYGLNSTFIGKQLGINRIDSVEAVKSLGKGVIFNIGHKKLWVKNFLFYQQQLPLEKSNQQHKNIILILEKNLPEFNNNKDIMYILEKVSTTNNKKMPKKFAQPSLEEFKDSAYEQANTKGLIITDNWIDGLFSYYQSNGWKVGGKTAMKDWKAAIKSALIREQKQQTDKGGKINKIIAANSNMTNIETKN